MQSLKTVVILALFVSAVAPAGCGGDNGNANFSAANRSLDNSSSAKTNTEELGLLVNLPYEPDDVIWKENQAHKKLTAVLHFSSEDANKIAAEAATRQQPENVTLSPEPWFHAELIAQSEMTGDDSLNGLAYAADTFFQEPYTAGRIVRIEGADYFVLELSAK